MHRYMKVEGQPDLSRDRISGAIISLNTSEYDKFMEKKRERDALKSMGVRMSEVEARLIRIEEMFRELLGRQ